MFEFIYFLIFSGNMLTFIWCAKQMNGNEASTLIKYPTLATITAFVMCALWPITLLGTIYIIYKERTEK